MNITINIPQFFNIDGKSGKNFNYLYPLSNGDNTDSRLFILCDGESGSTKGDATTLVTKGFHDYFTEKRPPKNNTVGQLYMNDALRYVERIVREYVQTHPKERGMRSTVALLYFNENDTVTIAWVGNTRIYHVRGNQILTKTQDHTVNAYQNGKKVVVPRAISGIEPAYLSLSIIKDIRPGDYFLMCSAGVVETLDDRNIRYLLSQGDGNEGKNQAIVNKIKELCRTHSYKGCGLFLLQINSTAEGNIADMPVLAAKTTTSNTGIDTGPIRRKGSGFKKPSISKSSRNALLMALMILMIAAIAFAYKFQQSKPEVVFEQQMIQAQELVEKGAYEEAIALYQSSLNLELEDTSVFSGVRAKIRQTEEQQMLSVADKLYKESKLLKARDEYKRVLSVHPNSDYASKKLQSIEDYLLKEKTRLVVEADSLMQVNGFEEARNSLFTALYFAQEDTQLLYRINDTYRALKEDTIDLALAIGTAIQIGTAPPASSEETEEDLYADVEDEIPVEEEVKPRPRRPQPVIVEILPENSEDSIITHREYKELLSAAKTAMEEGDLELSVAKYKAALEYNETEAVVNQIAEINKTLKSKAKYDDLMQQADEAFQSKKFKEAEGLYSEALKVKKDDGYAAQRVEISRNMIAQAQANDAYKKLISDADKAFNANNFATARELYQRALSDASDPGAIKSKIAQCNQKISAMQADISKKRLRKGEKLCETTNYNSECYYHLRDNNLLYSVSPQVLFQLGKHFEGKDTNRAKECYNIAAGKGSSQASDRLKQLK